ncbi:hypothetical protein SH661x_000813 [Planctomicrobium sp. SH661]|uniref:hypothetical protein n=1 Tax=Planctomicrobium sp. SH661 TaxID=3448124 RepID=UPI003F5B4795
MLTQRSENELRTYIDSKAYREIYGLTYNYVVEFENNNGEQSADELPVGMQKMRLIVNLDDWVGNGGLQQFLEREAVSENKFSERLTKTIQILEEMHIPVMAKTIEYAIDLRREVNAIEGLSVIKRWENMCAAMRPLSRIFSDFTPVLAESVGAHICDNLAQFWDIAFD